MRKFSADWCLALFQAGFVPPGHDRSSRVAAKARMGIPHVRWEAFGDPGHEIADFAQAEHAELIVLSSHGRTGLTRLLIGSVAERVVRLAHCPVLVLKK